MPHLEAFLDRVRRENPFTDNRVTGPAGDGDVEAIHQAAFSRLTDLALEAHARMRGIGAMLWGEAGVGKSHLLARLERWAVPERRACYVYLHNLQASPDHLPRSLLKSVVSYLTLGRARNLFGTKLYRLVNVVVQAALQDRTSDQFTWPEVEAAYDRLIDRLAARHRTSALLTDRLAWQVLFRLLRSAWQAHHRGADDLEARVAVRWLSGDYLDPAEAIQLGLGRGPRRDEPVGLADGEEIKRVLVVLTQLAWVRNQPFLLCLDQVDNLDAEQVSALARFLEALIDSASNLLVVTAGVKATLLQFHTDRVIQDSAWDRVAQVQVGLQRVSPREAGQIIAARLQSFVEPFRQLPAVKGRVQDDALFPLGRGWLDFAVGDKPEVRPRDAISWAREEWRQQQEALARLGGPRWLAEWGKGPPAGRDRTTFPPTPEQVQAAIERQVDQKFQELVQQRHKEPHTLPADADRLAKLIHDLFLHFMEADPSAGILGVDRPPRVRPPKVAVYHLFVRHRGGADGSDMRTGILCLATGSANSMTAGLRRLANDPHPPERVLLITEERHPLALAGKGQEYHDRLSRRGPGALRHLQLDYDHYARMDAFQALVGMARSGDLEVELPGGAVRAIPPEEVIATFHAHGRFPCPELLRTFAIEEAVVQ